MAALLPACSAPPPDAPGPRPEPAELWAEPARLDLRAGEEATLQFQVNDRSGQPIGGAPVRFYAQDPQLLHVDPPGRVRAQGPVTALTYLVAQSGAIERRIPVTISAGTLERLVKLDPDPPATAAGQALPGALRVRALDAWGNAIAGTRLSVESLDTASRRIEIVTDGAGIAVAAAKAPGRAGRADLLVRPSDRDAPRVAYALEVLPAPPAEIRAVLRPADARSSRGRAAPLLIEVAVLDGYGNPVPGVGVDVRDCDARAAALTGRTDAAGLARLAVTWRKRTGTLRVAIGLPAFPGVQREFSLAPPLRAQQE